MKRILAFASLATLALVALPGGYTGGGGQRGVPGLGKDITASYPWSGTLVLWVDDGKEWTYDNRNGVEKSLLDIFQEVNDDSGLTGTDWAMHFVTGVNIWGANALGDQPTDSTGQLSEAQLQNLYASGLVEIALHGANDQISDPFTGASGEVKSPWAATGLNAAFVDSGSVQWIVEAGYHYLADTLNIPTKSYMTNGHRIDGIHRYYISKWFDNCRAGTIFGSTFPVATTNNATSNPERGSVMEHSRTNFDPMAYWWGKYDASLQEAYSITFPVDRMFVAHLNATNLAECKEIASGLANMPGMGVMVWHDQNRAQPTTNPDLDGIVGVEEFIRYLGGYCRNGLLNREGPRLQVLTMNEAMSKTLTTAYMDGGVVGVPNLKLDTDDLWRTSIPYGYAPACSAAWADSGWGYINPDSAAVANEWFGYFDGTGLFATNANSDADGGADTPFHSMIQVYPVIPGSRVRVGCYASANRLLETGAENDRYSDCYIDIKATFLQFDFDYSDSLNNWHRGALTADTNWLNVPTADPANAYLLSGMTGGPSDSTLGYSEARVQRRFHKRDAWSYLRTQGWGSVAYATGTLANAGNEYDMRWREFTLDTVVPWDCYWIRVLYTPTGWTDATSDSLGLLPFGPFMSPR